MEFEKVVKNKYGFYELKDKTHGMESRKIFEEQFYQESMSLYRKQYRKCELQMYQIRNAQTEFIINKNLGEVQSGRFLDIGCGEGFTSAYFKEKGYAVDCLDFSSAGIETHNPWLMDDFLQGDAVNILPKLISSGKKYEVIHMRAVLDMMYEPEKVLGFARRLLEENGILIIEVANNYSKLQLKLLEEGKIKKEHWLDIPGHPSYFNREGLINFVEESDFRCIDFYADSLIDLSLINDLTNYYEHPEIGKQNFEAYVDMERMLMDISLDKTMELKRLFGSMGLGRTIIAAFCNKKQCVEEEENE